MAALKALKVKEIITSAFPKTNKVIKHFNKPFFLVRNNRNLESNELIFRTKGDFTKPEMKQVLSKLYGIDVTSMASWNKMGKFMFHKASRKYYRKPDFKKFSVRVDATVPPNLQSLRQ